MTWSTWSPSLHAIWPITEKMTKPANTLVAQLPTETISASLCHGQKFSKVWQTSYYKLIDKLTDPIVCTRLHKLLSSKWRPSRFRKIRQTKLNRTWNIFLNRPNKRYHMLLTKFNSKRNFHSYFCHL